MVVSVGLGSLMPVFQYRVVVDEVLVPNPAAAEMPSFYLTEALHAVAALFAVPPLTSAVLIFIAMFVVQSVVGLAQQLLLTSGAWTEPEDDGFSQEPMGRSGF